MKWLGLLLLVLAYALLVPGLTEPMLSVSGTVEKAKLVELGREIIQQSGNLPGFVADLADRVIDGMDVDGVVPAFDKTQSILGTARDLYANGDVPVAVLIVLFSVIVPAFKALVLSLALCPLAPHWRRRLAGVADASGKWSMADVFVVAIFIVYLAAGGIRGGNGLVEFESSLGTGFWYFLAYCLVSLLGTQLLVRALRRELDVRPRERRPHVEKAAPDSAAPITDPGADGRGQEAPVAIDRPRPPG